MAVVVKVTVVMGFVAVIMVIDGNSGIDGVVFGYGGDSDRNFFNNGNEVSDFGPCGGEDGGDGACEVVVVGRVMVMSACDSWGGGGKGSGDWGCDGEW